MVDRIEPSSTSACDGTSTMNDSDGIRDEVTLLRAVISRNTDRRRFSRSAVSAEDSQERYVVADGIVPP